MRLLPIVAIVFVLMLGFADAAPADSVPFQMMAQNGSGESGTARLYDIVSSGVPIGSRVVVHLVNENTTGDQPAEIHAGTCSKLDPAPKYPLKNVLYVYPLKNVVLGHSNTVIDGVPLLTDLLMGANGHYVIIVHESAKNLKRYVSCGNIPYSAPQR